MATVKDHYDRFLGEVYSWILGDFDTAYRKNVELFAKLGLEPGESNRCIDLGCGPGCQALPLAELGYDILAIDFCQELLDELQQRSAGHSIRSVCDDILNFPEHLQEAPDLIVCMGDTLVHLPDRQSVSSLIEKIAASLNTGGKFIYAIRDYIDHVPDGPERFIPVRASDEQIFTCFLDYRDDVVHVHDILHKRAGDTWQMAISDYLKLRLDTAEINGQLEACGFLLQDRISVDGMITVVAEKT